MNFVSLKCNVLFKLTHVSVTCHRSSSGAGSKGIKWEKISLVLKSNIFFIFVSNCQRILLIPELLSVLNLLYISKICFILEMDIKV